MSSTASRVTSFFSRTGMRTLLRGLRQQWTFGKEINHHRTGIFPPTAPLDEADNEEDENDQSHSAHNADEPTLRGDVHLILSIDWTTHQ